jgi:ribosomal-protein-alanine N-acetyltransferase
MWSRRSQRTDSEPGGGDTTLIGRRLVLRPMRTSDFEAWQEVRRRCDDWLVPWEPRRIPGSPDAVEDRQAFAARCGARQREMQMGSGFSFGLFVHGEFAGEININSIHRGAFQSAYVGYWIDERHAGQGYMPEAVVLVSRFAFECLMLHRLQISIIPRNTSSRRVVEKLGLREEGIAVRYLEINGVWEDHARYAITAEDWAERAEELVTRWS